MDKFFVCGKCLAYLKKTHLFKSLSKNAVLTATWTPFPSSLVNPHWVNIMAWLTDDQICTKLIIVRGVPWCRAVQYKIT